MERKDGEVCQERSRLLIRHDRRVPEESSREVKSGITSVGSRRFRPTKKAMPLSPLARAKENLWNARLPSCSPVENAQATLAKNVRRLLEVLPELTGQFEILIVDDGSSDATFEVAERVVDSVSSDSSRTQHRA